MYRTIVISGIQLCNRMSGIPRYVYEIVTRLDDLLTEDTHDLDVRLCYPAEERFINYTFKRISVVSIDTHGKRWMSQCLRDYATQNDGLLIDFSGSGIALNKNEIVLIHDLRPLSGKYDSLRDNLSLRLKLILYKLYKANIYTVSEDQRKYLKRIFHTKDVKVISPGWEHMIDIKCDNSIFNRFRDIICGDYYYSIGSPAKHKNYRWILEVAKLNSDKQFVLAGSFSKDESLVKEIKDIKNIVLVGYINDQENKALLVNCKALINCSYYEGFGLTPLEAISLGKNVILSDLPVSHEIYGDNITYFSPNDYSINLNSIKLMSELERENILKRHSWNNSARQWLEEILAISYDNGVK